MKKNRLLNISICLVAAITLTVVIAVGVLFVPDSALSDLMYQRSISLSGEIVILGIDSKSLEMFGPWPWSREIIAAAIDTLNEDDESRPCAIGVDILFGGYTNEEADNALVSAAGKYNNVVLACYGEYGGVINENSDNFYEYAVADFIEPFSELKAVTRQGHINSMYDGDGILRHSILNIKLSDGVLIPSFAYQLYKFYAEDHGLPARVSPPVNSKWQFYQSFSAKPGGFLDGMGVYDLLAGNVSPDFYASKIVLIGPADAALQDYVITAADHAQDMLGVEYQANVIKSFIDGNFKKKAHDLPQIIFLLIVTFTFLVWMQKRRIIISTVGYLVIGGTYIGICFFMAERGILLHPLWLPVSVTVIYISSVAINYTREALEKRQLTNTFKKYVAPEIVSEIIKKGSEALELGGKLTDVAVLFVDIRGFTPMSEVLSPVQVVEILNKYLTLTSSCIMNNHGTLDKFIGDATMAFWGAPLPQEDYVFKAVKAGLDMIEGSKALGEELFEKYGRTVSFGIGVNCGAAVIGNIGAEMRMDYTAIGDTVNTASRLESNAPAGKMLISRAVADALEGRIAVTSLGDSIKLKGKSEGFEIFEVNGLL